MTTSFNIQPQSDLSVGWREFISRTGSTQTSHWLNDGSQVVMTLDSSFGDRELIIQQVLGYSSRSGTGLQRQLPMRHPDYDWMYATSLDMNGVNWTNKFAGNGNGPFSYYDINRTRITFSALPFDVFPDNAVEITGNITLTDQGGIVIPGGEWNRFVIKNRKPTTEFASTDRIQWKFATGPSAGKTLTANVGFKIPTVTLTWKWMWVPDDFLNDVSGNSINVENALGTVNSNWFAGFPPQTLYLDTVDYEAVNLPVDPQRVLGYPANKPPRVWNVTLNFKYRNPPQDPAYNYNGVGGHNLAPDISKTCTLTNPDGTTQNGFFWYPIVTIAGAGGGSGPGGSSLYNQTDFTNIFKAVS